MKARNIRGNHTVESSTRIYDFIDIAEIGIIRIRKITEAMVK